MNALETVVGRMRGQGEAPALYWRGETLSYNDFFDRVENWVARFDAYGVGPGIVCGVLGDYSPQSCSLFIALMRVNAIIVPLTPANEFNVSQFIEIAGVQRLFHFDSDENLTFKSYDNVTRNELVASFEKNGYPGLIVFTSGSTGEPKGILHDCERVMSKFVKQRKGWRTALFLLMDHFGGFNTLLGAFAYGGTGVCLPDRSPAAICRLIEESRATLLPTTPTFLNLLITSGSWRKFDLSSIKLITYGTEVMPEAMLAKVQAMFPKTQIKQTYGLSELGVLRSKSLEDGSTWVRIGGDGFETKIIDDILWVRSEANMIGYLNAPNPIDSDGWMCTDDLVEVKGDYIRFLGRATDLINVGGQKVYPVEIEAALLQAENVRDAVVHGIPHPLMGQMVGARVSLLEEEDAEGASLRLRRFCRDRLAKFKVPARVTIVDVSEQLSDRYKKVRKISL